MTDTTTEAVERIAAAPWFYASEDISATLRALLAERDAMRAIITEQALQYLATSGQAAAAYTAQMEAEARVKALEIELKISIGGCDANNGDRHTPITLDAGKYYFCQECGKTMTKAEAKRHSSAAAIRGGPTP